MVSLSGASCLWKPSVARSGMPPFCFCSRLGPSLHSWSRGGIRHFSVEAQEGERGANRLWALVMMRSALFGSGVLWSPRPADLTIIYAPCCFPSFPTLPAHISICQGTMLFIGHALTAAAVSFSFSSSSGTRLRPTHLVSLTSMSPLLWVHFFFLLALVVRRPRRRMCRGLHTCNTTTYCLHVSCQLAHPFRNPTRTPPAPHPSRARTTLFTPQRNCRMLLILPPPLTPKNKMLSLSN